MKDVYMREMVRKAYHRDKKSKRQISRELGIHRDTVKRILSESTGEVPRYTRKSWSYPVLEEYLPIINTWLKEDEEAPRKQRHTIKRIYDRLTEEYEFSGSYSTIRDYVGKIRKEPKESFLPLAFAPGEMAQVDWIEEATVVIAGKPCRINIFGMVLNYSGAIYFEAFERRAQECFLTGHTNAFQFFGGVAQTVTYDNLKTAVTKILKGRTREENEQFVEFRSGWLFDSRFCQPGRGNEKGRVENMVKFAERNLLTPVPCVGSLSELNRHLLERCKAYQERIQQRQTITVGERLEQERASLLPIPQYPPECCRIVSLKANQMALVQFETNRYSVPSQYAYTDVWLKAFVEKIEISNSDGTIAVYPRLTGKLQESIRFEHYRKVLERKPGGAEHLRATDKEPIPLKTRESGESAFPKVPVQAPDITVYSQLYRQF